MTLIDAVKVLADAGVAALRHFGDDLTRENAARLLPMWAQMRRLRELDEASADEVTFLVLGRFSPAEPPTVPGKDFAPKLACYEANYVNESAAFNGRPFKRWCNCGRSFADPSYDVASAALMAHIAESAPLVEVTPDAVPAPQVWDDSVPPGGFVCSVCRTPVESEPCPEHGVTPDAEVQP